MARALDKMKKMAKPAVPAGKGKSPQVTIDGLDPLIERFVASKKAMDEAKAINDTTKAQITADALPALRKVSRDGGKFEGSCRLNGKVTFVTTSRYSAVNPDDLPELRKVFGKDTDRYFQDTLAIGLTPAAAGNEAILKRLLDAFGDEFGDVFTVKNTAVVTEEFHRDLAMKPAIEKKAQPFLDDDRIKPYSPTVRI